MQCSSTVEQRPHKLKDVSSIPATATSTDGVTAAQGSPKPCVHVPCGKVKPANPGLCVLRPCRRNFLVPFNALLV